MNKLIVIVLALLSLMPMMVTGQTTLFASNDSPRRNAITNNSDDLLAPSDDPGALMTVDINNGNGTVVGTPISGVGIAGIDFTSTGELIGITDNSNGPSRLITIDSATGAVIGIPINVTVLNGNSSLDPGFSDLAIQPGTDIIYATVTGNFAVDDIDRIINLPVAKNDVVTINRSTGVATVLGSPISEQGFLSIAFGTDGTLYGIAQTVSNAATVTESASGLLIIDPSDGALISSRTLSPTFGAYGLGFDPVTGQLWASECCDNTVGNIIHKINPATGVVTTVGPVGNNRRVHDLAFANVPIVTVPTLGEWGIINLSIMLLIMATVSIKERLPQLARSSTYTSRLENEEV